MPLTLTITSARREAPGLQRTKIFETRGGTIGRTQGNDWVLPDPERFVSASHARVECRDGIYYLGDTSTNGVFVNGSGQAVGAGKFVALRDGDRLLIGDYEISVSIKGAEIPVGGSLDAPVMDNPADPLAITSPTVPPSVTTAERKSAVIPDDPLDFLNGDRPSSPSPWASMSANPFAERSNQSAGRSFDQGTPLDDFFAPPSPGRTAQIPEDWDLTGFSAGMASADQSRAVPSVVSTPPSSLLPQLSQGPVSDRLPEAPEISAGNADGAAVSPSFAPHVPPRHPTTARGDASGELRWFFQGAGLNNVSIPEDHAPVLMTAVGRMFREIVQGIMEVLMARSSLKSEFRMAMTTVRPIENNPLKFSVDVEEALRALLTKQGPGYLAPEDAVHEAIIDIKGHQMAMMAGMQAVFRELLRRFDPEAVERAAGKGGTFGGLLSAARKAKCWDAYAQQYRDTAFAAQDHFQRLFGEEFTRAYEEQIERLREAPRRKP